MHLRPILFFLLALLAACGEAPSKQATTEIQQIGETYEAGVLQHPKWSKDATIYEVNVRQHTPEGTLKAFEQDIQRIADMGIEILWLMPIHPIGELNRKGRLGSYYAAQDYKAVNPEFGSLDDLKSVVRTAHSNGMRVILDWVANHTAFDHVWSDAHKDYYLLDSLGNLQMPPGTDWSDVAQLNYENAELRAAMIDAMAYWLREADVDGFRCDVADFVPIDFWEAARDSLVQVKKDLFMLAEAENPKHHHKAFDMSYSWELMHILNGVAGGEKNLSDIDAYMAKEDTNFVGSAYRMTFTTNHDENSWNGTVFERYGEGHLAFATLAFTIHGMPLVYSGQEAGNSKVLRFFDKDTIEWGDIPYQDFYSTLLHANREHEALWNGHYGGDFIKLQTADDARIYAFMRKKDTSEVITVVNLSDKPALIEFRSALSGNYESIFNQQVLSVFTNGEINLEPWGYQVFIRKD